MIETWKRRTGKKGKRREEINIKQGIGRKKSEEKRKRRIEKKVIRKEGEKERKKEGRWREW